MSHPVEAPLRTVPFRAVLLSVLALAVPVVAPVHAATDVVSVTLQWTAPGDDSTRGRATSYDLRRSSVPITELSFNSATQITGLSAPQVAGSAESFVVAGLTSGVQYYFALRTRDDAGNVSKISNLVAFPLLVDVGSPLQALDFSTPYPNPCRSSAHFAYSLPRGGDVGVDVYDVSGRSVRNLIRGFRPAGTQDLVWDLRSEDGATVAPGVYLVRAKIAGQTWNRRVVVTR